MATAEDVRRIVAPLPRAYEREVGGRAKFLMPRPSDLRYNWLQLRLASVEADELAELLVDAWAMCVPNKVAAAYFDA